MINIFQLILFACLPEWLGFYNIEYYIIMYILFGLIQTLGWPNLIVIVAKWFGLKNRGLILGMWATCQPFGNIIGTYMATLFFGYGYEV